MSSWFGDRFSKRPPWPGDYSRCTVRLVYINQYTTAIVSSSQSSFSDFFCVFKDVHALLLTLVMMNGQTRSSWKQCQDLSLVTAFTTIASPANSQAAFVTGKRRLIDHDSGSTKRARWCGLPWSITESPRRTEAGRGRMPGACACMHVAVCVLGSWRSAGHHAHARLVAPWDRKV